VTEPRADECTDAATCLQQQPRIWVVRNGYYEDPLAEMTRDAKQQLLRQRYRVDSIAHPASMTVALLVIAA
jgi:hypothetical protein